MPLDFGIHSKTTPKLDKIEFANRLIQAFGKISIFPESIADSSAFEFSYLKKDNCYVLLIQKSAPYMSFINM